MPIRRTPLLNDHYYHLFNRSIAKIPIFTSKIDFVRILNLFDYYRFANTPLPFSKFKKLSHVQQEDFLQGLKKDNKKLVEIICFCLMPNHFHLITKQLLNEGIKLFLKNFQDAYAKYFNIKYQRTGSLFQNRFKAILIEDDSQLLHLSRYIHLNPYSSLVVKTKSNLLNYQWSSLGQYLKEIDGFCRPQIVMEQFKSKNSYQDFLLNRADYQKNLSRIRHLISE